MKDYRTIDNNALEYPEDMQYVLNELIKPLFKDSYVKKGSYELGKAYIDYEDNEKVYHQYFLMYEDYILFEYYRYDLIPHIDNLNKLYNKFWKGLFLNYTQRNADDVNEWDFNMIYIIDNKSWIFKDCILIPEEKCEKINLDKNEIIGLLHNIINHKCLKEENYFFARKKGNAANEIVTDYYNNYNSIFNRSKILLSKNIYTYSCNNNDFNYVFAYDLLLEMTPHD